MKTKENNNLILMTIGDKKRYFTSMNRAGRAAGLAAASVKWAIYYGSELITNNNEKVTFKVVDGSEIPYKYINN